MINTGEPRVMSPTPTHCLQSIESRQRNVEKKYPQYHASPVTMSSIPTLFRSKSQKLFADLFISKWKSFQFVRPFRGRSGISSPRWETTGRLRGRSSLQATRRLREDRVGGEQPRGLRLHVLQESLNKYYIINDVNILMCSRAGFSFAGLEYGTECYCGHNEPDIKRR